MPAPTMKLKPYQHDIACETIKRFQKGKQYLYAAQMGSGKTLMAIAVAQRLMDSGELSRVLVVCPNAVINAWPREVQKWYKQGLCRKPPEAMNIKKVKKEKRLESLPDSGFVVVNYESCWERDENKKPVPASWIRAWKPEMVICDEIHCLGSPDSMQSIALHKLNHVPYKLGLSGTPIQNIPLNLWSVYKFLDPTIFHPNYTSFKARHVRSIKIKYKEPQKNGRKSFPKDIGYKNLDELHAKFHANAVVLQLSDVLDMPPYRTVVVPIKMKAGDRKNMELIKAAGREAIASGEPAAALKVAVRLRRFLGGFVPGENDAWHFGNTAKIETLLSMARQFKKDNIKFVVFCQFTAEVVFLCDYLKSAGLISHTFYGQTKPDDRQLLIDEFQMGNIDCLVCQTSVAGTGVTLTRGTVSIFYSLSFKFVEKEQAEFRMWRMGQENMVTAYFLTTTDSYDEHIYATVQSKQDVATSITAMKEMFGDGPQDGED